jgi:hypothetical protein
MLLGYLNGSAVFHEQQYEENSRSSRKGMLAAAGKSGGY